MEMIKPIVQNYRPQDLLIDAIVGTEYWANEPSPMKIGDIVKLRCGGPKWLVVDFDNKGHCTISRKNTKNQIIESDIPQGCIYRVSGL
jgi:hypothetical protein